ncbi:MAG: 4-hydroxyphenylacetate 3-hydroxylase [Chloroflexota bacterium]|nr:4-hydroxyphenylacetate 3-hydroxylase [Chloroflexota bacterium]MDE2958482.1 4-hydroxyphenylacetate 3-hydroxylase [Chloroflexota bacterium]
MALKIETAPGAMTGARYIESLRDGREVWLDGAKVKDVTTHPATTGMVHELARIYDLQHSEKYRDEMTFVSPETGNRCSLSWLLPRTHEDLKKQRRNSEIWNEESWGQLGRSPDILAPFITGLVAISDALEQVQHPRCNFAENVINYHRYCMENDLFLTHALGDPQVDRSAQPQNETRAESETEVALHVVEETNEGVIVHGAKQLATAAPISNETYVSLSATFMRRSDPRFILSFSIPTDTAGMKMLCREPVSQWVGSYGHPLGAAYDEQDSMLFFDHVLVPWDRIFMLYDSTPLLQRLGSEANFRGWGNLCRIHQRMKLMTAVATLIAEAIGVIEYREVSAKLGEMAMHTEMWRHAMDGVEHNAYFVPNRATRADNGLMSLGSTSGMNIYFAQTSQRMVELLREICGSGMIMQPSEADLANPEFRPYLDRYMPGKGVGVEYKSRLFRLAHDLAASSFGMRQEIYEYWHGGDPNRNRINLLRNYDQTDITERIKALIAEPLRS